MSTIAVERATIAGVSGRLAPRETRPGPATPAEGGVTQAFPVSGNIEPAAFPHLLVDLHGHGATGSLKVTGPHHPKALYFRSGRVLFGSSNDPRDQLGSILIESGKITREQLDEVNAKVGPGNPLAKVLSESGFVNQRELGDAARVKVERILADVLSWDSGTFEFEDGVLPKGAVDLKLSTEKLLLERRAEDPGPVLRPAPRRAAHRARAGSGGRGGPLRDPSRGVAPAGEAGRPAHAQGRHRPHAPRRVRGGQDRLCALVPGSRAQGEEAPRGRGAGPRARGAERPRRRGRCRAGALHPAFAAARAPGQRSASPQPRRSRGVVRPPRPRTSPRRKRTRRSSSRSPLPRPRRSSRSAPNRAGACADVEEPAPSRPCRPRAAAPPCARSYPAPSCRSVRLRHRFSLAGRGARRARSPHFSTPEPAREPEEPVAPTVAAPPPSFTTEPPSPGLVRHRPWRPARLRPVVERTFAAAHTAAPEKGRTLFESTHPPRRETTRPRSRSRPLRPVRISRRSTSC